MKTLLSAVALAALAVPAVAQMANPMVGGAEMPATNDIVTNAMNSADHTTLVAAVSAAGLVETLQGAGPFTVLAPTNTAFAELPAETIQALLQPQNKDRLAQILTCHVVPVEAFSSDIVGMIQADGGTHAVQTVGGCVLQASVQNGSVVLTDEQGRSATVTIADVDQSNGVIHVIDRVLLPSAAAQQ
jgi:uncharacterized surface protein with fasciclin (FAS1) repeats